MRDYCCYSMYVLKLHGHRITLILFHALKDYQVASFGMFEIKCYKDMKENVQQQFYIYWTLSDSLPVSSNIYTVAAMSVMYSDVSEGFLNHIIFRMLFFRQNILIPV